MILDHIGAKYLEQNLGSLAVGGRLVEIGLMGGAQAEVNLGLLLTRRLAIIGSTLRGRSIEEKAAIVRALRDRFGDSLAAGRLRPVIHSVLPLAEAACGAPAHEVERALRQDRAARRLRPRPEPGYGCRHGGFDRLDGARHRGGG